MNNTGISWRLFNLLRSCNPQCGRTVLIGSLAFIDEFNRAGQSETLIYSRQIRTFKAHANSGRPICTHPLEAFPSSMKEI